MFRSINRYLSLGKVAPSPACSFSSARLFAVNLDGSGLQQWPNVPLCIGHLGIAKASVVAACATSRGVELLPLQAGAQASPQLLLATPPGRDFHSPTWAADGKHLALLTVLNGVCAIALYGVAMAPPTTNLTAIVPLPQYTAHNADKIYCALLGMEWSPSGDWLVISQAGQGPVISFFGIDVATLFPQGLPYQMSPAQVSVLASPPLIPLGMGWVENGPAWKHTSDTLTFLDANQQGARQRTILEKSIETATHKTGAEVPILSVTSYAIWSLAWTADDQNLVFVYSDFDNFGITPAPATLYVYTPSAR